jgi:hypothetical protein
MSQSSTPTTLAPFKVSDSGNSPLVRTGYGSASRLDDNLSKSATDESEASELAAVSHIDRFTKLFRDATNSPQTSRNASDIAGNEKSLSQRAGILPPTDKEENDGGDQYEDVDDEEKDKTEDDGKAKYDNVDDEEEDEEPPALTKRHSIPGSANVYTECGRHGDDWLFGGISDTVKSMFSKKR